MINFVPLTARRLVLGYLNCSTILLAMTDQKEENFENYGKREWEWKWDKELL